jgi:MFS family permease
MFDTKSPFSKILFVYLLWVASWLLGGSFFEVYFLNAGMPIKDIFFSECFWFVASMFTIPLVKRFKARDSMVLGILVSFLTAALLIMLPSQPSTSILFRLLVGLTHISFWVPFNTMYYELRKEMGGKEDNAVMGALYYALSPILSLVLPLAGGFVAAVFGYQALFLLAMASFAITGIAAWMLVENREYRYDLVDSLKSISGLRSIIFMEGFSAAIIINVTFAIMPLIYFDTPFDYGVFISLSTLFAIAASIFAAKLSDKAMRRREYLLPVVLCFGIFVILIAFTGEVVSFFLCLGLATFFARIFFPLPLALTVDNSKSILDSMVGREYMLNLGRLVGSIITFLVFLFYGLQGVLVFQGISMLLYIPVFENRKKKLARH